MFILKFCLNLKISYHAHDTNSIEWPKFRYFFNVDISEHVEITWVNSILPFFITRLDIAKLKYYTMINLFNMVCERRLACHWCSRGVQCYINTNCPFEREAFLLSNISKLRILYAKCASLDDQVNFLDSGSETIFYINYI